MQFLNLTEEYKEQVEERPLLWDTDSFWVNARNLWAEFKKIINHFEGRSF